MRMVVQAARTIRHAQPRPFDLRSLLRLGIWGMSAAAALGVAVASAYSTTGSQRLMAAFGSTAREANRPPPAGPAMAELLARTAETENETQRLSEAVRALGADRERLITRIASLEQSLEEVTGSIRRQAVSPPAAGPAMAPQPATTSSASRIAPLAPGEQPPAPPAAEASGSPPPAPESAPAAATGPQTPAAASRVASAPAIEASEAGEAKTKPEFGLDLGGAANFDALRALWNSAKSGGAAALEGLNPVVAVRENIKSRTVELRLVVGPLGSVDAAERACATLMAARRFCEPAAYEGQQFTLAIPQHERRPAATTPERRSATVPAPARPSARPNP